MTMDHSAVTVSSAAADESESLANQMSNLTVSSTIESVPNASSSPDPALVPRYLFRVYRPGSAGFTSAETVASLAAYNKFQAGDRNAKWEDVVTEDISAMNRTTAAAMLGRHLQGWFTEPETNLVSWTSSLLFAIQYIIFLNKNRQRMALEAISLCVIDTSKFEPGTFQQDLALISAYRDSADEALEGIDRLRTGSEYYFGEYLSQGVLDIEGKCRVVSGDRVINESLFLFRPEFKKMMRKKGDTVGWAREVDELRVKFYYQGADDSALSLSFDNSKRYEQITALMAIADAFGSPWRLPIAAHLMGFYKDWEGSKGKIAIPKAIFAGFSDHEVLDLLQGPPPAPSDLIDHRLEEVQMANNLLLAIMDRACSVKELKEHIITAKHHLAMLTGKLSSLQARKTAMRPFVLQLIGRYLPGTQQSYKLENLAKCVAGCDKGSREWVRTGE